MFLVSLEAWRSEVKAATDLVSGEDPPLAHRWLFLATPVPSRRGRDLRPLLEGQ